LKYERNAPPAGSNKAALAAIGRNNMALSLADETMHQHELDDLWSAFVVTRHDPEGFVCMLDEAGDHVIQSVATGQQWQRKVHSSRWVSLAGGTRPWLAWLR
jgi:hypothetical protein